MSSMTMYQFILTCCLIYSVIWPSLATFCSPAGQCPGTGPNVSQQCPPNEYFVPCVNRCQKCEDRKGGCGQSAQCLSGCNCFPGFWRNKQGRCIPEFQCPALPPSNQTCPLNEHLVSCINQCQKCEDRNNICMPTQPCKPGCDCVNGFRRNKQGKCIPEFQCPECPLINCLQPCYPDKNHKPCPVCVCPAVTCNKDEQYYTNKPDCYNTCENFGNPAVSCLIGQPGCFCKDGLVKRKDGKCVRLEECSQLNTTCKNDEEYYTYKPDCKNTCENYNNNAVLCPIGKPGCFCKEGLVKRKDGKCVRPEECSTSVCGPNSTPSNCVKCAPSCSNRNPICTADCVQGCDCNRGYIKDDFGNCIPENQCPNTGICGPNEVHSNCVSPCNDCVRKGNCPFLYCNKGCDCRPGYRRYFGICIPENQCPTDTCGVNEEHLDCGTACPDTCDNRAPKICTDQCVNGCFCKKGYIREKKGGRCIPESQCPPTTCGPNSHYTDCASLCPPTCNGEPKFCPAVCVKGCVCNRGFINDGKGNCIPENQCPPNGTTCGPNSHYSYCASLCPPTCNEEPKACPAVCVEGCVCNRGFINDGKGKCIPENQCPPNIPNCGLNEYYSKCVNICNTCELKDVTCNFLVCNEGCDCKSGYTRNKQGICIRENQCPSPPEKCGRNEERIECGSACPPTCDNRKPGYCTFQCVNGCFCKKGFIREKKGGKCIPESQCPKDFCGLNEVYSKCVNICNTCELKGSSCAFIVCNEGCDCKPGYTRNEQGICIPANQCPDSCGKDEQFYECTPFCTNRCNPIKACPKICKRGCYCKKGLVLNDDGKCVKKSECNNTNCKKNEQYYECKPTCNNTCENYNTNAPCPLICLNGCDCKPGLVRRKDGECVKPEKCKKDQCGPNSTPSDCVFCEPTCRNPKPEVCAQSCTKGCECNPGFIKDDEGNCIPKNQCPKPNICGLNEVYSKCVNICNTCESKDVTCNFLVCNEGCDCIPGYTRNEQGICIPENQCPSPPVVCGPNSTLSNCASRCPPTCRDPGRICIQLCEVGCMCNRGYILDDYGNCIPQDQCPVQCGPNSTPSDCIFCEPTCRNPKPEACAQSCRKGCECNPGFIKDDEGNCIPKNQCPKPITCGPNSKYSDCASPCPPMCGNKQPSLYCPTVCVKGCVCNRGFINDGKGNCIPESQCPPKGTLCGPNEIYSDCVNPCNDCKTKGNCQFIYCNKGCDCRDGYRRFRGTCIPENECPKIPQCSIPNCDYGCEIDYSSKPCPSCKCDGTGPQCSMPKCAPGCQIDYSSKPCPSCKCDGTGPQCSIPKCDDGCQIDYTSKPCPSCKCDGTD